MKTYKVKDQEEAVKNAKLFYEAVKLAWGLQVTYEESEEKEEEEKEKEEEKKEKKNNDNETEATDEILNKISNEFLKY